MRGTMAPGGVRMANGCAFDVPPPGAGLNTVTWAVPGSARSAAVISARSSVALTYVVCRSNPFHRTTELCTKFVPVTFSVSASLPANALDGSSAVMVGAGFTGCSIVNVRAFDAPPPGAGLNTVTCAWPGCARSPAGICARSSVALTYVVWRFEPFQRTTEPWTKFVPRTVSAPLPAAVLDGSSAVIAGTGFAAAVTVNGLDADVPPPGAGFDTATCTTLGCAMSAAVICARSSVPLT